MSEGTGGRLEWGMSRFAPRPIKALGQGSTAYFATRSPRSCGPISFPGQQSVRGRLLRTAVLNAVHHPAFAKSCGRGLDRPRTHVRRLLSTSPDRIKDAAGFQIGLWVEEPAGLGFEPDDPRESGMMTLTGSQNNKGRPAFTGRPESWLRG